MPDRDLRSEKSHLNLHLAATTHSSPKPVLVAIRHPDPLVLPLKKPIRHWVQPVGVLPRPGQPGLLPGSPAGNEPSPFCNTASHARMNRRRRLAFNHASELSSRRRRFRCSIARRSSSRCRASSCFCCCSLLRFNSGSRRGLHCDPHSTVSETVSESGSQFRKIVPSSRKVSFDFLSETDILQAMNR